MPIMNNDLPPLEKARKLAFENSCKIHEQNKRLYDQNHRKLELNKRDLVYITKKSDISKKKLESIRTGPYEIIEKLCFV